MATLNDRTINRINFHMAQIAKRTERLAKLEAGSKSYDACMQALNKDIALVTSLKASLQERSEAGKGEGPAYVPAKPRGELKGQTFEIALGDEPSNDTAEFAYACHNGAVGHRFDLVG